MLLRAYGEVGSELGLRHDAMYYWAPAEGGTEVYFLIQRGRTFVAVEVKAKETLAAGDFAGLRAIADLEGVRRRIMVFLGDCPFRTEDGIDALPVGEFLRELQERRIKGPDVNYLAISCHA